MKINSRFLHVYRVLICMATFVFTSGCSSFMNLDRRPELARRPYNNQEKLWQNIIHESYPKWQAPAIPIETRKSRSPQTPTNSGELASDATPATGVAQTNNRDTPTNLPAVSGPIYGHQILPSKNENGESEDLPPAILDFTPIQVSPPSETEAFKIVPENRTQTGRQGPRVNQLRRYTVRKGETLIDIARKIYGDQSAWKRIYNVNRDILENPNRLKPGISLKLP